MRFPFFTILIAVMLAGAGVCHGQSMKKYGAASPSPVSTVSEPTTTPPNIPLPFTGKIFSIDKSTKTFTTQNSEKKLRVFQITAQTKLTKGSSAPAAWSDLKVGTEVRGTALKQGNGWFEALTVKIGPREENGGVPVATPAGTVAPRKKQAE